MVAPGRTGASRAGQAAGRRATSHPPTAVAFGRRQVALPLGPAVVGTAARKELQATLLRRFGRNLTTMGPLLTGAAVASYLNRRATRSIGETLKKDLRKNRVLEG